MEKIDLFIKGMPTSALEKIFVLKRAFLRLLKTVCVDYIIDIL